MRKFTFLLLSLFVTVSGLAKTVTISQAHIVADNYISHYSDRIGFDLDNSFSVQYNDITAYHVFNYSGGGFVVVSADDAVIPVLAQSNEGYLDQNISNPNAIYWFDSYSKEIGHIIAAKLDNTETLKQWNRIRSNEFDQAIHDAGPLLTTTWDQGEWYNYYCPVEPNGQGGHVWAGCVATAMAQIMKYYNFPAQGVLSHSYEHPTYGNQTANFGDSTYQWQLMGNSANGTNFHDIASLLYQVGVSVDMNYNISGSGASDLAVLWALPTYFNYDASNIDFALKENYTDSEWKELLKTDLHASQPVFYSGFDVTLGGHAWVCDGWRWSDDRFHMNWGWSGSENGWYHIGQLNTFSGRYNDDNAIVKGIKPGNPDLIVRIMNLYPDQLIGYGSVAGIECSMIKGTPNAINIYVDSSLVYTTSQSNFTYNLNTNDYAVGRHSIKVESLNAADTAYHEVTFRNSNWISQASSFVNPTRGILQLYIVDSLVVWATAYDGITPANYLHEFTHTVNGGVTWSADSIAGCSGLAPSMIFALNADIAFCPMFRQSGSNPQGIYATTDGGTSWSRQASALFTDPASFPNVVHFFNNNDGFCMGDPVNGEFEIYTTSNGGNNWVQVIADNIPDPVSGEFGVVSYYSAVNDKAWFGSNMGRVFRTSDKGLHWDVSTTSLTGKYVDVNFADDLHGLAQDKSLNTTGSFSETFDGGLTWYGVIPTGQVGTNDFCFVPGTENTWVSTGTGAGSFGVSYSCDGGHSWAPFADLENEQMLAVSFFSKTCGWAGGFNNSVADGGMFKFVGMMPNGNNIFSPVLNLYAVATARNVNLTWDAPSNGSVLGYNVYRNDTLITATPIIIRAYNDFPLPNGKHSYCVKAVYYLSESDAVCTDAWITYGIPENEATVKVYPNPATEVINIETPVNFSQVSILTLLGQEVYRYAAQAKKLKILTAGFDRGIYIMQVNLGNMRLNCMISIN